jgi:hypothetical protein
MTGTLLTSLGLNPSRVLTVASTLRPGGVLLLTTANTEYLMDPLRDAAGELGLAMPFTAVPADPYRVQVTLERLRRAVASLDARPAMLSVVLAGGTKPMLAAQAVLADEMPGASLWSLDEPSGVLRGIDGRVLPVPELPTNLAPLTVARLHAGLHVAVTETPGSEEHLLRSVRRLRSLLLRPGRRDVTDSSTAFETGVAGLLRALLPPSHDVYGSVTVTLRDPNLPTQAAREPGPRGAGTRPRRFEVDGLVVRGAQTWTVEAKFTRDKLHALRTAAAELAVRARHVGGDLGHSLLVFRRDDVAERMAAAADPFNPGRLHVMASKDLKDATSWVLEGRPESEAPAILDLFR